MPINSELFDQAVEIIQPSIVGVLGTETVDGRRSLYLVAKDRTSGLQFSVSFGESRETWKHPYDEFARGKAALCERTGMSSGHVLHCAPWLLQDGDPLYAGGVIEDEIIVAVSGLQDHFDEMFSRMFFNILAALATAAVKKDKANPKSTGFLGQEKPAAEGPKCPNCESMDIAPSAEGEMKCVHCGHQGPAEDFPS